MKFSIPYIVGLYDYLSEKGYSRADHICDIYFSFSELTATGRGYPEESEDKWNEVVKIKSEFGINLNYTWNPSVYHPDVYMNPEKYVNKLYELNDRGIDILTISSPFIAKNTNYLKALSKFKIRASVLNNIDTLEKVVYWYKYIGIDSFVLYGQINRNFDEIKRISEYTKKFNIETSLLVNEGCHSNCPYRVHEFSLSSFSDCVKNKQNYEELHEKLMATGACLVDWASPSEQLRIPNIGPSKIDVYEDYIDYVKLINKNAEFSTLCVTFDAYINKDGSKTLSETIPKVVPNMYDLVSWDVLYNNGFFENTMNCKMRCASCTYCFDFYETNLLSIIEEYKNFRKQKKDYFESSDVCYNEIKSVIDKFRKEQYNEHSVY